MVYVHKLFHFVCHNDNDNCPGILKKKRRAFSLIELIIAVVVLGILSTMLLQAGTASQNKARTGVVQNDLDGLKGSVYQALMAHPNVMKFKDNAESFEKIIGWFNNELDDAWQFSLIGSPSTSGLIAQTSTAKDPWGNPYGLYIYTNEHNNVYSGDKSGTMLTSSDSCAYIVIVSAGRNATGGPLGYDGTNIDPDTNNIISTAAAVNNSDGIDDLAAIIRVKNGTLLMSTFGTEQSTLGTMKDMQWIYGMPGSNGGIFYNFKTKSTVGAITAAGSIDQYLDTIALSGISTGVVGSWN